MAYYESELAKVETELNSLLNDQSPSAYPQRIALVDRMSDLLSDYVAEVQRRGDHEGAVGLRRAAEASKSHAQEEAKIFCD
jgi:hypothetical protein